MQIIVGRVGYGPCLLWSELPNNSQKKAKMAAKGPQMLNTREELNELVRRRAELAVCIHIKHTIISLASA